MTVSTSTNKISYTITTSTNSFAFNFPIFSTGDLRVIRVSAAGVETVLTLSTHYSVSAATNPLDPTPWPSGGTVTTVSSYSDGQIIIKRDLAFTQGTSLPASGSFPSKNVEAASDRAVMLLQQLNEQVARAFVLAESDTTNPVLPTATERASKFLAFDASGNLTVATGSAGDSGLVVTSYIETLLDDSSASAARTTLGAQADVITTRGDVIRGSSSGAAERLAVGAAGLALVSDGTDAAFGRPYGIVQMVAAAQSAHNSLSTVIPLDDTIPQSSEGTQVISAAITPTHASNTLLVEFQGWGAGSTTNIAGVCALFLDSETDARQASAATSASGNYAVPLSLRYVMAAGGTSAMTFAVRVGPGSTGNFGYNGIPASRYFGGISQQILTITEIKSNG